MESPYSQQLSEEATPSPEELKAMIEEKARELFKVCDVEEKGFVNKRDMRRLVGEIPGHDEGQLEYVFDSLDSDGNGFLTLEEFTEGFGGFLGINSTTEEPSEDPGMYEVHKMDQENDAMETDFRQAMDSLGANEIFTEQDQIKGLWTKLRQENPDLLGNFEEVLQKVSFDIRTATSSKGELEQVLKSRSTNHEEEVSKLYEEMERQIQGEKEKLIAQEKEREKRDKEEMDAEMRRKEELLQELLQKQTELEVKLSKLSTTEKQTKEQKDKLEETNNKLFGKLEFAEKDLEQTKSYLRSLQDKVKEEKRARADASLRVTRGIAEERASLCKQLSLLKDMNKKLVDERDAVRMEREIEEHTDNRNPLIKQGSVMSDYFDPANDHQSLSSDINANAVPEDEDVEYDFEYEHSTGALPPIRDNFPTQGRVLNRSQSSTYHGGSPVNGHMLQQGNGDLLDRGEPDDMGFRSMDPLFNGTPLSEELAQSLDAELEAAHQNGHYDDTPLSQLRHQWSMSTQNADSDVMMESVSVDVVLRGPGEGEESPLEDDGHKSKQRKVKKETEDSVDGGGQEKTYLLRDPQRLYKVVFVGDSYVGKTSLMHRVCNNAFVESFNATIGVDFQVKTMTVNGHSVAIQLWDTAGQERFRSITRHYFRKADAVIVVFDLTSEKSFLNVRNWMTNIEEVTDEHVVKVLVGNKLDLEDSRQVQKKSAESLAASYQCLFYEASAKSGANVTDCIEELAHQLLEKEDREMEEALKLINEVVAKKKCCRS
ncbi:EF-hand calcium-binding domain-containing protein 4B-like isoform X2 [Apostichopus japonicus]|uniref:EF-hand calcium-binding domain-containing protein 4B-like isoform X2 n=1 Tax=Stichopus japonicus TaxID=307972 RepID=UPI003AB65C53